MFHSYTIRDGLPENTANVLMQDSKGQIWIGTQAGAVVFDGARFEVLGTESESDIRLSNNMVESLYEDVNGLVYIGTRNGMNVFNQVTQKVKTLMLDTTASFSNNLCRTGFYEDSVSVWSISKHSLFKINKISLEISHVAQFAPKILGVMQAYENGLLVSADSTLFFYDPQNNIVNKLIDLPSNITSVSVIDGVLWIGTLGGIYHINGETVLKDLQTEAVLYIHQSSDGRIWIGTTNGIAELRGSAMRVISPNAHNRLEGNLQLSFLEDRHHCLWFGSNAALNRLIPMSERIEKNAESRIFKLPSDRVNSIAYSEISDLIAIGTDDGVNISQLDPGSQNVSVLQSKNFLPGSPINFTAEDVLGRIWVGSKSGDVYCFQDDFTPFKLKGRINGIRGFYYDKLSGLIYIAGSEGLFAAGNDRLIFRPEWLKHINYTVSLLHQEHGFWVSHTDLIYAIDLTNKSVSSVMAKETQIPSYMLTDQLIADSCNWFSSISGGVFSYAPADQLWARYNLLKGKNVWSTYSDFKGRFWSNADDGLYIHNGKKIYQKLDIDDGLNYSDFAMSAHCQLKNGVLIYGNKKGLSIINPNEIEVDNWSARLYVSALEIDFKRKPVSELDEQLLLSPDEKSITLYFGLDDFLFSSGAEISYKLENLNSSWSSFLPLSYPVNLNGLSSGDYSLEVRVRDKSARVSDQTFKQAITILPHFYETRLFRTGLFFAIVLLFVFIANFRARQKQKAAELNLKTERAISAERERISRDLHDSIGARLTKIIADLDIMELQTEAKHKAVSIEEIAKTRDYTQDTINNLRETIWTLDAKIVRLQDVFHQSKKYIERYLTSEIAFEIHMDDELFLRQINPETAVNIFRIIQELTQNMLKYSKATSYSVNFAAGSPVQLTVWDNGTGFDMDTISKGEGLKNILKRLGDMNGKLVYENRSGSKFIIDFN